MEKAVKACLWWRNRGCAEIKIAPSPKAAWNLLMYADKRWKMDPSRKNLVEYGGILAVHVRLSSASSD